MTHEFLEFLRGFDIQTIISLTVIMWLFKRNSDEKFQKIDERLEKQGARTDRLYEMYLDQRKETDQKFYDLLKAQK